MGLSAEVISNHVGVNIPKDPVYCMNVELPVGRVLPLLLNGELAHYDAVSGVFGRRRCRWPEGSSRYGLFVEST